MLFKIPAISVDKENPFLDDQFGRQSTVEFLSEIIEKAGGPFVLAIDSPWGTGKTTTVQMLKRYMENAGFMCVYFDAWRADYVSDPLIAMLGTLNQLDFSKDTAAAKHFSTVKKVAGSIGRRLLIGGVRAASVGLVDLKDYEGIIEEVASGATEDIVDAFNKEQELLELLRGELEKAVNRLQEVEGNKKTLVFFIDELDRCRPDFALAVLERMKHLFDLADIHFVLSIDKGQLESSVSAVHGEKINASEYLRRFFDLEFGLPEGESKIYTSFLVEKLRLEAYFSERKGEVAYDKDNFVDCFSKMADIFSLTLRAREKCLTRMVVVASQTPPNHYLDPELTAFLIIVRSIDNAMFKLISTGAISTSDVVKFIKGRAGGADFMDTHMGAVLYGLLIIHHADREVSKMEVEDMRDEFRNAMKSPSEAVRAWAETVIKVIEAQGSRRGRNLRFMAAKVDLSARLSLNL